MKIDQNPFSLYDFLGYFIPGSILLYFSYLIITNGFGVSIFDSLSSIKIGNLEAYLPFVIIAYILGHLQSFLSSYTVERYYLWRYSYPFRFLMEFYHDGYINRKVQKPVVIFKRILLGLFIFPITFWDIIIGEVFKLNYLRNRKFSAQTKELLRIRLQSLLKMDLRSSIDVNLSDADNFTLLYHFTLERVKNHQQKFSNYVALYGFNRSISFINIVLFWFVFIRLIIYGNVSLVNIVCLITISVISYLFYLNFCKFYRRFSCEVIMAFVSLKSDDK